MKKGKINHLDFVVDKLTNSIENVKTGDSFKTDVSLLTRDEIKGITKKNGWLFDWKSELKAPEKEVYKLTISGSTNIQGLISITFRDDHVYMHLIESAPFNKGKDKAYLGVPGNLVAFACRVSYQRGGGGYLSFNSKTQLIEHYIKSLGAVHFGGTLMVITPETSLRLIDKYFNDWHMGLIKEPLNVDFVVDPRPLTEKERKMISDFIKADKLKKAKMIDRIKKSQKRRSRTKVS